MGELGVILFFGGVIAFIVIIVLIAVMAEKKRREGLMRVAGDLGLTYMKDDPGTVSAMHNTFRLFSRGRSRKTYNIMSGKLEHGDVCIFDYKFVVGSGKNSSTYLQTVVSIKDSTLKFPKFVIEPENFFHKIGQKFGFKDINFDDFPAFSKMFLLKGDDEEGIRKTFNGNILTWFEGKKGICCEGMDDLLIVYRPARRVKPDDICVSLEEAKEIYAIFRENFIMES